MLKRWTLKLSVLIYGKLFVAALGCWFLRRVRLDQEEMVRDFNPQDLTNTTWGFCKVGFCHREAMETLAFEPGLRAAGRCGGGPNGRSPSWHIQCAVSPSCIRCSGKVKELLSYALFCKVCCLIVIGRLELVARFGGIFLRNLTSRAVESLAMRTETRIEQPTSCR